MPNTHNQIHKNPKNLNIIAVEAQPQMQSPFLAVSRPMPLLRAASYGYAQKLYRKLNNCYKERITKQVAALTKLCKKATSIDEQLAMYNTQLKDILDSAPIDPEKYIYTQGQIKKLRKKRKNYTASIDKTMKIIWQGHTSYYNRHFELYDRFAEVSNMPKDELHLSRNIALYQSRLALYNYLTECDLTAFITYDPEYDLAQLNDTLESFKDELAESKQEKAALLSIKKASQAFSDDPKNNIFDNKTLIMFLKESTTQICEKNPDLYLSPKYIITHLSEILFILAAYKRFNNWKNWDDKADYENDENTLATISNRLYFLNLHVDAILARYGKTLSLSSENNAKPIIDIEEKSNNLSEQCLKWKSAFRRYQVTIKGEKPIQPSINYNKPPEEELLKDIEKNVNFDNNMQLNPVALQIKDSDSNNDLDKSSGFFRLNRNILDKYNNSHLIYNKATRLSGIVNKIINNLKDEHKWNEDSDFAKVADALDNFIKIYSDGQDINGLKAIYQKDPDYLLTKIKAKIEHILKSSPSFREIQYASFLLNYLEKANSGYLDLVFGGNQINANDRQFIDMKKYRFEKCDLDQPLFTHTPNIKDIGQGELGDCYFLAAITSIVVHNPTLIQEMMRDNGNGTVSVRFFNSNKRMIRVTVDKSFPVDSSGDTPYAWGSLWIKILEKAYAVAQFIYNSNSINKPLRGNQTRPNITFKYADIDGGSSALALQHLTGINTNVFSPNSTMSKEDTVARDYINVNEANQINLPQNIGQLSNYTMAEKNFYLSIKNATDSNKHVCIGTRDRTAPNTNILSNGLLNSHAYTVMSAEEHPFKGKIHKWIRLFDPHADNVPVYKQDGNGNIKRVSVNKSSSDATEYKNDVHGVFLIELKDAFNICNHLDISD